MINRTVAIQITDGVCSRADLVDVKAASFYEIAGSIREEAEPCSTLLKLVSRSFIDRDVMPEVTQKQGCG